MRKRGFSSLWRRASRLPWRAASCRQSPVRQRQPGKNRVILERAGMTALLDRADLSARSQQVIPIYWNTQPQNSEPCH
jgi:hypothetical protein